RVGCKKCSLNKNYKDKVINNVTVIKLGYTGRNGQKYYKCKCNKCNEELFLTREEIIDYKCDKVN
ncbi:MAG: hypothetical protein KBA02_08005, partial [Paludibacteraceae bacterium]|nr:hypothetical protein [Paludibacteraceae bacterium]